MAVEPVRGRTGMMQRAHLALAGTRVLVAGCAGLAVFFVVMALAPWQVAVLAAWDAAVTVVLVWVAAAAWRRDGAETAQLATREDDSRAAADVLIVSTCVASLAAVALGLVKASDEQGLARVAMTGLAVLTVVLSWAGLHAVFMLRYARLYYNEGGGIEFNESSDPDYRDFAYVALTIGMTYQVSDTELSSKSIRRTAARHAVLSYLFGTAVVAVTINLVAELIR